MAGLLAYFGAVLGNSARPLQLARLLNLDGLLGLTRLRSDLLNGLDDVQALDNLAEDDVLAVQPRCLDSADEKLAAVGVGSGVGHGQDTRSSVLQGEVLVLELLAVDTLTTGTVAAGEVTTLKHELGDDAVEGGTLVVEGLSRLAGTLLTGAEGTEVLGRLGNLVLVELHNDPASWLAANADVEENAGVGHFDGNGVCLGREVSECEGRVFLK
jgi:hypothetical protein